MVTVGFIVAVEVLLELLEGVWVSEILSVDDLLALALSEALAVFVLDATSVLEEEPLAVDVLDGLELAEREGVLLILFDTDDEPVIVFELVLVFVTVLEEVVVLEMAILLEIKGLDVDVLDFTLVFV